MKIFPVEKIREVDAYTIVNEPIASIDLMERAAGKVFQWLLARIPARIPYVIVCGPGNNGGDGLAVARMLAVKRRMIQLIVLNAGKGFSEDFTVNYERVRKNPKIQISELMPGEFLPELLPEAVLVDAVFGSGLNKPLTGWPAEIIDQLNKYIAHLKVAIDIPSGLFGEDNSENSGAIFRAAHTLTFQFPKLSFFFAENAKYTGEWEVLPIGLHPEFIRTTDTKIFFTEKEEVMPLIVSRPRFSHKGNYGHALLLAGSFGKMGAAILASKATLKSGAGLLTARVPAGAYAIMQTAFPEAMVSVDDEEKCLGSLPDISAYSAIGIGPGLGQEKLTANMLKLLIQECHMPAVYDADALNILGENKTWLAFLQPGSILSPHPKEFDRMAGDSTSCLERWQKQMEFSRKFGVFVVLKGAYTSISSPDGRTFFNSSGNPGMATAGSGDVLTGILLGLLSQGYAPLKACILGVYLHGLAGDIAAQRWSMNAMTATNIIESLPKAWKQLGAE